VVVDRLCDYDSISDVLGRDCQSRSKREHGRNQIGPARNALVPRLIIEPQLRRRNSWRRCNCSERRDAECGKA